MCVLCNRIKPVPIFRGPPLRNIRTLEVLKELTKTRRGGVSRGKRNAAGKEDRFTVRLRGPLWIGGVGGDAPNRNLGASRSLLFMHSLSRDVDTEFIATNSPEVSRRFKFMEDVVNRDRLWTSLLTGLSITEWSDSPLSYKLRVFENCCTVVIVLDATLSALEDSQQTDWRTPELSLLLQHFELFITRCFQDAFTGKDHQLPRRYCQGSNL
jgi:hypothetical protein